jgi:hypothetical protein
VDPLYQQIISEAQEQPNFKRVMGTLMYLRYPLPLAELALLLQLTEYDIRTALSRCHSVLAIPDDDNDSIRPHHASLRDYLTDQERSENLVCAPAQFHASIALDCLRAINDSLRSQEKPTEYPCIAWYYHSSHLLSHADGNEQLHLFQEVKAQVAAVDVGWLKWWMAEALAYAGIPYIRPQVQLQEVSIFLTLPCLCCTSFVGNITWSSDIADQVKENRHCVGCKTIFLHSCMIAG